MTQLCFITTCMGRLAHLQQSLPLAMAQAGASCVVVDYSCPDQCGAWVEHNYPGVPVVRVPGRDCFSAAAARNARGARAAAAPWLCFFDADVLLDPAFSTMVLPALRPRMFYLAHPLPAELTGTLICSRAAFESVGGYDEVLRGWGRDDLDLYDRFQVIGVRRGSFTASLVRSLPHDDALRVQHHDIKERGLSETINHIYSQAKVDLMKLSSKHLSLDARQKLYEQVNDLVRRGLQTTDAQELMVDYCRLNLANGWKVRGKLHLVLEERNHEASDLR